MIVTKTPFRMSFFGGGTDIPSFFREHGGAVISTTINQYCYVTARQLPPFFEYRTELCYTKIERVTSVEQIQHPAIREAMKRTGVQDLRLTYDADLPARTGLGTSSSFAVGMLNAFYAMQGIYAPKKQLADEAIYLERTLCGEAGGWQDQIAAAFGGLNHISFSADGYHVRPIPVTATRKQLLQDNLLLFFTGFTRFSGDIQQSTEADMKTQTHRLLRMAELTETAEAILTNSHSDLNDFGRLLHESWQLKRQICSRISTDSIDALYQIGRSAGALGGKLLGAGGGGFLLFYAEKDKHPAIINALSDLIHVPFRFESGGTRVVYHYAEGGAG